MDDKLERPRRLRQNMPDAERLVWSRLRNRRFAGFKFRRQVPLGSYIVDFVCFARRLVIEMDGGQHTLQQKYDADRTSWLEREGFRVVRFWNHEVFEERDAVEEQIWRKLHENPLTPNPSPTRGEGSKKDADQQE
jgi:adenine-specific DNA-methyltransferase